MKTVLIALVAVLVLGVGSVALAGGAKATATQGPVMMTDAQMDSVVVDLHGRAAFRDLVDLHARRTECARCVAVPRHEQSKLDGISRDGISFRAQIFRPAHRALCRAAIDVAKGWRNSAHIIIAPQSVITAKAAFGGGRRGPRAHAYYPVNRRIPQHSSTE